MPQGQLVALKSNESGCRVRIMFLRFGSGGEALERLAPHHDHVAHRHFFEPLEILRQVPWDFAAAPITRFSDIAVLALKCFAF